MARDEFDDLDEFVAFESPKILIDAAKKNIAILTADIKSVIANHTYTVIKKTDNKSGDQLVNLRFDKNLPCLSG